MEVSKERREISLIFILTTRKQQTFFIPTRGRFHKLFCALRKARKLGVSAQNRLWNWPQEPLKTTKCPLVWIVLSDKMKEGWLMSLIFNLLKFSLIWHDVITNKTSFNIARHDWSSHQKFIIQILITQMNKCRPERTCRELLLDTNNKFCVTMFKITLDPPVCLNMHWNIPFYAPWFKLQTTTTQQNLSGKTWVV